MADCGCHLEAESPQHARALWTLLAINGGMFIAELFAGWVAESTALIADSFDMLADAAVYAVSLYAVSRSQRARVGAARLSGYSQGGLGALALLEVARRAIGGSEPDPAFMIAVSAVALIANTACLRIISRHREGGVHMRASYIFSQNDVIANSAVLLGGAAVAVSGLALFDLMVGIGVGVLVLHGGVRILREARAEAEAVGHTDAA